MGSNRSFFLRVGVDKSCYPHVCLYCLSCLVCAIKQAFLCWRCFLCQSAGFFFAPFPHTSFSLFNVLCFDCVLLVLPLVFVFVWFGWVGGFCRYEPDDATITTPLRRTDWKVEHGSARQALEVALDAAKNTTVSMIFMY